VVVAVLKMLIACKPWRINPRTYLGILAMDVMEKIYLSSAMLRAINNKVECGI
jgi:hypothetical protein